MDKINLAILKNLRMNARQSWQDIGRTVHLSGQAVAMRVLQMQDAGEITGYTIRTRVQSRYLVTVFMTSAQFDAFEQYIVQQAEVLDAYKTAGEGCYQLTVEIDSSARLEAFLSSLLSYGTYRVHAVVRQVK
jgi:Lrp/AsnC family leucine-responsive transcriptional regulator